jgi:hypothetical protein
MFQTTNQLLVDIFFDSRVGFMNPGFMNHSHL